MQTLSCDVNNIRDRVYVIFANTKGTRTILSGKIFANLQIYTWSKMQPSQHGERGISLPCLTVDDTLKHLGYVNMLQSQENSRQGIARISKYPHPGNCVILQWWGERGWFAMLPGSSYHCILHSFRSCGPELITSACAWHRDQKYNLVIFFQVFSQLRISSLQSK